MKLVKVLVLIYCLCIVTECYSFDPKTHIWIAQQIINDLSDDGMLTINGKKYAVNKKLRDAILNHQSEFRMGNIGPDAFPDPVVGQMTVHPGIENGWKTDDWINHVIIKSSYDRNEEKAFAYGYVCHAASDVFAHTYVNTYSGDIFSLLDGELEVEVRHYVLEKYIGNCLPPLHDEKSNLINDFGALINVPEEFVRNKLIMDDLVSRQYEKEIIACLHLLGMKEAHRVVKNGGEIVQDINKYINGLIAEYYKLKFKTLSEVEAKYIELNLSLSNYLAQEGVYELAEADYKARMASLEAQKKLIEESLNAIDVYTKIEEEKRRLIKNLEGESINIINEANSLANKIEDLKTEQMSIPIEVVEKVCEEVTKWIGLEWISEQICDFVTKINGEWEKLENEINSLNKNRNDLLARAVKIPIQIASEKAQLESAITSRVAEESKLALLKANLELYEEIVKRVEDLYQLEIQALKEAEIVYFDIKEEYENLKEKLDVLIPKIIDQLKEIFYKNYLLTLFMTKWESDIIKAIDAYVIAGEEFSRRILREESGGLDPYVKWHECWLPVFTSLPHEIPGAVCEISHYVNLLSSKVDELIHDLGDIGWIIVPQKKLEDLLREEFEEDIKRNLLEAYKNIASFFKSENFAEMTILLAGKESVSKAKLISEFQSDESNKYLLNFSNVFDMISKDMHLEDEVLNPQEFNALYNAIVLCKLALLSGKELNELFKDYAGNRSTIYGDNLYPNNSTVTWSLMVEGFNSIDGSCQWQQYALPYPRREGVKDPLWPAYRKYGVHDHSETGFRFWVDPTAREKVFKEIFHGPIAPSIYSHPDMKSNFYKFRACDKNPFPNTSKDDGSPASEDNRCNR